MSVTYHYCETTFDKIFVAVARFGCRMEIIPPLSEGECFRLTWREPEEPDKLYGVDLWKHADGRISIDKGHTDCFNGQSRLAEHLKRRGIEVTYSD